MSLRPAHRPAPRRATLVALFTALALGACQTTVPALNQPLPRDPAGRPDYARNYGFGSFPEHRETTGSELMVLLAFSGGGTRSAAFAHGALRGLRAIPVQGLGGADGRTLLSEVDYIAAVSGGSFPAAHYGLFRDRSFETFPEQFLHRDIEAYIYGMFLLPWNWRWMVDDAYGTNDRMAEVYDALMFRGATFADLARRGPPLISINATEIATGLVFPFQGTLFGLLCSDMSGYPVARAVAASSAYPVVFSAITLQSHAGECGDARPPVSPQVDLAAPQSETSRRAQLAQLAQRLSDAERTRWVHLMDGGIADNLALRGLLNILISLDDEHELFRAAALRTRRVMVLSVDGQAASDPTLSQQRSVGGLMQLFSAVSGTQINAYSFETLALAEAQVEALVRRFRRVRCATAPVIGGRPCDDVRGELVHVSLAGIEDPELRRRMQSIPTALTLPREDVDALVEVGESLVARHPVLQELARDTPAAATPRRSTPRPARRGTTTAAASRQFVP
ncbi:patatin-like phospholipase family protein [Falsiroseomonas oryziterrae]|uniref:patatin-like phospholipase family protein n=1 Tax=Falsiroseomonas oryziterrae TaxID=2911368 RepID=UPI001F2E41EB|nr:patatin-like phospholipase family protein [Roseomonas sp. NPKOSM-4]